MWYYYFLDNGGKEIKLSCGKTWRRTVREMHYCCTIEEAVIMAKELTFGESIEICYRYGLGSLVPSWSLTEASMTAMASRCDCMTDMVTDCEQPFIKH